jgi:hypothetical protein
MKNFITLVVSILICTSIYPGSGIAKLECKSESGRTTFSAELQDITGSLEGAKFSIDGSTIEFNSNEQLYAIFDYKIGVFTLYIKGETDESYPIHKYVEFWAIPSSFKIIKDSNRQQIFEFRAKIVGTEPRPDMLFLCPIIEMNCRLEYEI